MTVVSSRQFLFMFVNNTIISTNYLSFDVVNVSQFFFILKFLMGFFKVNEKKFFC